MPHSPFRRALRGAAAFALAAGLSAEADAWQAGNWTGRTVYSDSGAFGGCRMSVAYNNGIMLHFLQLSDFSLLIGMSRADWVLDPRGAYAMGLVIDRRYVRRARGVVLPGLTSTIFLGLGHDRATRDLLRRSLRLTLVNNRQNFDFQLAGTAAGLARLERCIRERG
jgi:hypothetical protein